MTTKRKVLFGLAAAVVAAQLVPISRTNPPVTGAIDAPRAVQALLDRSCIDCHSNETVWPWYSRIAPVSWLVARDVRKGREELNFSEWADYSERRRNGKYEDIAELVENGEMPLKIYLPLHPNARLSDADRRVLIDWARTHRTATEPEDD